MIFKAAFWITFVAVLLPHEPNIGFGRPGQDDGPIAGLRRVVQGNIVRVRNELRAEGGSGLAQDIAAWGRRTVAASAEAAAPIGDNIAAMAKTAQGTGKIGGGKITLRAGDSLP